MSLPWRQYAKGGRLQSPQGLPNLSAWYDAKDTNSLVYDSSNRVSLMADKSGNSGAGSATSVGLVLNGVVGAYAGALNAVPLQITGDIDLRVYITLNNWANGSVTYYPISKFVTSFAYALGVNPTGSLVLSISTTGADTINTNSTATVSFGANASGWIRATRAQTGGLVNFYTSTDGISWTLLGTANQVASSGTAIFAGTSTLTLGTFGAAVAPLIGTLHRAQIYAGLTGTDLRFDANFVGQRCNAASFVESSVNTATVTINGSALLGWVDAVTSTGMYLSGVASCMAYTVDAPAIRPTTQVELVTRVALTDWNGATDQVLMSKYTGSNNNISFLFRTSNAKPYLTLSFDGQTGNIVTITPTGTLTVTNGVAYWLKATWRNSDGLLTIYYAPDSGIEPTNWTTMGTGTGGAGLSIWQTTATYLEIGSRNAGSLSLATGVVYRAIMRNTIGGASAFDANFTGQRLKAGSLVESSSNAATVIIYGNAVLDNFTAQTNCLALNGVNANYASTPDSVPLSVAGDIDLRCYCAADDWSPTTIYTLIAKDNAGAGGRSFGWYIDTSGALVFYYSNDGTNVVGRTASSSANLASTANYAALWLRVTYASATGNTNFYTSTDGVSWTALGVQQVISSAAIFDTTTILQVGATQAAVGTSVFSGRIYRAQILNGIAGTVVFDANFGAAPKLATSFTESSTNAALVTVNTTGDLGARICGARDLVQMTVGNQPVYLPWAGSNYGYSNVAVGNNFSTPDTAATSPTGDVDIKVRLSMATWTPATIVAFVYKADNAFTTDRQFVFYNAGLTGNLAFVGSFDGTTNGISVSSSVAVPFAAGTTGWVRVTRNGTTGDVIFYTGSDTGSDTEPTWVQLGVTRAAASTALFNSASALRIVDPSASFSGVLNGNVYYAQLSGTINGVATVKFAPSAYVSGSTVTGSTGEVWTLNGGSTIVTRTCLYFDGTNDYLKAAAFALSQPETVYFVGQQVTWSINEGVYDGDANNSMLLSQTTATPNIHPYSTGADAGTDVGSWAISTNAVVTTIFSTTVGKVRINRLTGISQTLSNASANGFTLGSKGGISLFTNITASEIGIYSAAHETQTQDRWAIYAGGKWSIVV